MNFKRIAIDRSKHVFTLHGVDEQERPIIRRELKRGQVEAFFGKQDPTEVVLEACGGSHHWARVLSQLGHRVRLIPPQYVKPLSNAPRTTAMMPRPSVRPRRVPDRSSTTTGSITLPSEVRRPRRAELAA